MLLVAGAAGAVGSGVGAPLASAAEPGVTIDPGSPAGKEYALPVDRARHDATGVPSGGGPGSGGGSGKGSGGPSGGELFGAGIRRASHSAGGGGRTTGGRPHNAEAPAPGPAPGGGSSAAIPAASSSGDSSTGAVVGIVAGVLLLGGLAGLGARRLRAPRTSDAS
jgi:hypothetical protein